MFSECVYVLLPLLLVPYIESARRLNEHIQHYELLSYSTEDVHRGHLRAKRSMTAGDNAVTLKFLAHGRDFQIRLKRDLTTFSDDLVIQGPSGKEEDLDTSHVYDGYILGESGSHVFGSIRDGVFEGKIMSPSDGSWFVEKAHHYFQPNEINETHHSVIYHENDVVDPYENIREGHSSGCGLTEERVQWMNSVKNSGAADPPPTPSSGSGPGDAAEAQPWAEIGQKYTRQVNEPEKSKTRTRRATRPRREKKSTCSLFIQTDPLIWRHISELVSNDTEKTKEEILSLISQHVTALNYMYRNTKFDGRIEHRDIKFEVQRIKIDDDSSCSRTHLIDSEVNPFCTENIDVSNFLDLHTLKNYEDFCLAYVFTYRDFTGGILGLSWQASASGAFGGICEKYRTYTEVMGEMYQSRKRSLNTGIITFVKYNSRVPPKISQLTLAHQVGHNFGSPHDFPPECRPGGLHGNYIMFASATSGDRPNNSKFSPCSIGNISNVLDAIEDNERRNCFTVSAGAFCGNNIVEDGEECDCGYNDEECRTDPCCYPRQVSEADRMRNQTAKGCQRKYGTQCSPSQGPCCSNQTCRFIPEGDESVGKQFTECSHNSVCDGISSECPVPLAQEDKILCNNDTQLCINGECEGSLCMLWNLTDCFLTSHIIPNIDNRKMCEIACQNGTDTSTCRGTSEFAHLFGLREGGISLTPGSPCDNFQGYCDDFLKCRPIGAKGYRLQG